MRLSKYAADVKANSDIGLIYQTVTRQYYAYSMEEKDVLWKFLKSPNKPEYTLQEAELIQKLYRADILINDDRDEEADLEYLEQKVRFQNNSFRITIYTTNACNFRCTYCTQEHEIRNLEEEVADNVIAAIRAISRRVRRLEIEWFGGEPLLQYPKIRMIMQAAVECCEENKCALSASITTNGYLLNAAMLKEMKELHIDRMQITVDSNQKIHDSRRILANGGKTYRIVCKNIHLALQYGMKIVLRMNVDRESFKEPVSVLEEILPEYRRQVSVTFSNLFQEQQKKSTFLLYMRAIQLGYRYAQRHNSYGGCATCRLNGMVVDTDGKIRFCTNQEGENGIIGELKENGAAVYKNRRKYEENMLLSVRNREKCRNCIELPFCIGGCPLARVQGIDVCKQNRADGLTLEERAKLDYYSDEYAKHELREDERL